METLVCGICIQSIELNSFEENEKCLLRSWRMCDCFLLEYLAVSAGLACTREVFLSYVPSTCDGFVHTGVGWNCGDLRIPRTARGMGMQSDCTFVWAVRDSVIIRRTKGTPEKERGNQ
jgi:hypothetical protein